MDEGGGGDGGDNNGCHDNDGDDDTDGDGGETEHESGQETWEEEPPWDQLPRLGSDKIYANLDETDHVIFQDQFFYHNLTSLIMMSFKTSTINSDDDYQMMIITC